MVTVEFQNVGRGRASWSKTFARLSEPALIAEARAGGRLMSGGVDVNYHPGQGTGDVIAGGRTVGSFRVEYPPEPIDEETVDRLARAVFAEEALATFLQLPFRDQVLGLATLAHIAGDWTMALRMLAALRAMDDPPAVPAEE